MYNPELDKISKTLHDTFFPKKFAVEITAHCNYACTMCHYPQMQRPKGRMPFELWKKCADQIAAIAPRTECWFSFCGEPLLEPELLLRAFNYGESIGLKALYLNTNGMLLAPALADPLLDSGVDLIVFGLDGFSKPVYESIRVNGDRDVVYSNIEHLLKRRQARSSGPEIQVQFIEMDQNAHELHAFSEYWLARGATLKVRNKLSWGGKFDTPLCVAEEERIACPWAMTQMHIFWDGRIPRCPGDTEGDESAGNAWDDTIVELWKRLGTYRALHMQKRFNELPERCTDCKDWMVGAAKRIRSESEFVSQNGTV